MARNDCKIVRKISGLDKDELNNNGPYVGLCSQFSKVIGPKKTGLTLYE